MILLLAAVTAAAFILAGLLAGCVALLIAAEYLHDKNG